MHLKSWRPGDRLRRFSIWIVNCVSSFIKRSLWMPKNLFVKVLLIILNSKDYRRMYQNILEKLKTFYLRNLVFSKGLFKVNQCISLDITSTNWTMKRTQDAVFCKTWSWFSCLLTCVSCFPPPLTCQVVSWPGHCWEVPQRWENTRLAQQSRWGKYSTALRRCSTCHSVIRLL